MRFLTLGEIVELHQRLLTQTGGASGIRDLGLLESALAQPKATFAGVDLHPTLADKAAALGFALVANHAFIDGNKCVGHAAMEIFLVLNGHEVDASVDEQERLMLGLRLDTGLPLAEAARSVDPAALGRVERLGLATLRAERDGQRTLVLTPRGRRLGGAVTVELLA